MKVQRIEYLASGHVLIEHSNRPGGATISDTVDPREAARLLAGLEFALEQALRDAGNGKCLKCGAVHRDGEESNWAMYTPTRCKCGGILAPAQKGEVK